MITTRLHEQLKISLVQADELWVSIAMINDEGFKFIQQHLPIGAKQHYLVGLDLPTTVSVLKKMLSRQSAGIFNCRIYVPDNGIFHPKVYLVRSSTSYHAYVGSANLTWGGLRDNEEFCVRLNDQDDCVSILTWFSKLSEHAFPLSEENIQRYEKEFTARTSLYSELQQRGRVILVRSEEKDPYDGIDFDDRFFKRAHHFAFRRSLFKDKSSSANKERRMALERFEELHEIIFPQFKSYALDNLYPNVAQHLVSKDYHANQGRSLDAMWLSYGKSQDEIKEYYKVSPKINQGDPENPQSFINHARIQIRIEFDEIGIWILFGKDFNGGIYDRHYFSTSMQDERFRERFYNELTKLPEPYWIEVNGHTQSVSKFTNPDVLHEFCKADHLNAYFIIGRDYQITDT